MTAELSQRCAFETARLLVGPWHDQAATFGADLVDVVGTLLTESTTRDLPPSWQGKYPPDRAAAWVTERDDESPTLLAIDRSTREPVGLAILFETSTDPTSAIDVRIGYVIAEAAAGHGFATELVGGLVGWAQEQSAIGSLTGGVAEDNLASTRVLLKNGFELATTTGTGEAIYERTFKRPNE